jgi:hypothetical protein
VICELQMKVCGVRLGTAKRCSMLDLEVDEDKALGASVTVYGVDNDMLSSYAVGAVVRVYVETVA